MDGILEEMKRIPGCPGTVIDCALRAIQFVLSGASLAFLVVINYPGVFFFTNFKYLIAILGFQMVWSLFCITRDFYGIVAHKNLLHDRALLGWIICIDLFSAILLAGGAFASVALGSLLAAVSHDCTRNNPACASYQVPVYGTFAAVVFILSTAVGGSRILKRVWSV